jgi:predicted alpha/beta-hydrolase family hydrolase
MTPRKKQSSAGALLLTPGSSGSADHHTLVAIEQAVAPMPVARIDFPNRRAGKKSPDRPDRAVACIREEAELLRARAAVAAGSLVFGGRSFGGRMCSLAVAEGLPAAGLVLLSYPLHPPGKPDKLRTEHFDDITVPCLFVSGERDPFGSPDEFALAVKKIAGPVTQVWVPGTHDPKNQDDVIAAAVRDWLATL